MDGEHALGRVMTTLISIGNLSVTGTCLQGWPTSMLSRLSGPCWLFLAGDFNHTDLDLPELLLWRQAGWIEVQDLQESLTSQSPQPTFRGVSRPDRICLSPELAAAFRSCHFQQAFADHGALWGEFHPPDTFLGTSGPTTAQPLGHFQFGIIIQLTGGRMASAHCTRSGPPVRFCRTPWG